MTRRGASAPENSSTNGHEYTRIGSARPRSARGAFVFVRVHSWFESLRADGALVRRVTLSVMAFFAFETVALTLDTAFPPDLTRARSASPVILDRHGAWLRALTVEDGRWRLRADLELTDPVLLKRR